MHVLVVSNLYPPHFIGGYELQCQAVVDELRRRGHDVEVLTSTYKLGEMRHEEHVYRTLSLSHPWYTDPHGHWIDDTAIVPYNYRVTRMMLQHVRPEVVFFWSPLFLSLAPILAAQDLRLPTAFYLSDMALLRYQDADQPWWSRLARQLLWRQPVRLFPGLQALTPRTDTVVWENVMTCSRFIAEALIEKGVALDGVVPVHHGIPITTSHYRKRYRSKGRFEIVSFGQLVEHKGTHTLVDGFLRACARYRGNRDLRLTLIGEGDEAYTQELKKKVARSKYGKKVKFAGRREHAAVEEALPTFDLFVFPSEWDEPFSVALLEGMAAALPTVSTCTGGSGEILHDGENAVIYPAGDAKSLAASIVRCAKSEALCEKIGVRARADVVAEFSRERMVDKVEPVLSRALERGPGRLGLSPFA